MTGIEQITDERDVAMSDLDQIINAALTDTDDRTRDLENARAAVAALLRALDEAGTDAMHARDLVSLLREERDALRSKGAAVEALEDQWRRLAGQVADPESREWLYAASRSLRAALADGTNQ